MIWTYAATVFGIGRSPIMPGTVASAVSLPVAWVVLKYLGPVALFSLSFAVAAIGTWACDVYVRTTEETDPSECVIDEVAGQLLACALAPLSLYGFILAFALFRLFDISSSGRSRKRSGCAAGWALWRTIWWPDSWRGLSLPWSPASA